MFGRLAVPCAACRLRRMPVERSWSRRAVDRHAADRGRTRDRRATFGTKEAEPGL